MTGHLRSDLRSDDVNYRGPPQPSSTWQISLSFPIKSLGFWLSCVLFTGLEVRLYPLEGSSGGHSFPTLRPNITHFCSLSDLKTARQQKCKFVPKKDNFPQKNWKGATVWNPGRDSREVQVLSHNLPTEARKQRPHAVQNIALNKAPNGFTQPLPVRQFLTKKGQNVVEIHFTLLKIKRMSKVMS